MKIENKKIDDIINNPSLNFKFISSTSNNLNLTCNILTKNFFLDSYNYFPLTEEYFTFLDIFSWGDSLKYNNFYNENFKKNFNKNKKNFKSFSNVFVLGSSSIDNYYRNIMTFLPRLFFNKERKLKIAIHRNSSNKFRNFIKIQCKKMNIDIQFVFLDDGFYKFSNSQIPQFLKKEDSIKILNTLKINDNKKEKIYISRQNSSFRNLINESDVINKLSKLGFKVVDLNDFDILEQIKLFSNSEVIVSATGSALTNIVFCNHGTKIFEISPKYNFEYENNLKSRYYFISKTLKLDYKRIEADSVNVKKLNKGIQNIISPKVIKESNYYKNLLVQLDKIDKNIKI